MNIFPFPRTASPLRAALAILCAGAFLATPLATLDVPAARAEESASGVALEYKQTDGSPAL